MKTILSKRLKECLDEHNMTLTELADKSGVPMETLRNIYYDKVNDSKASTLMSIARVFNVSVNHLMGESFCSKEEVKLLANYRRCGEHGKSIVMRVAKYEANTAKTERESRDKRTIPCYIPSGKIRDGFSYDENEVVYIKTTNKEAYAAIKITSNAFTPIYCKGDTVLISDRPPEDGERVLFVKNGLGYIRQLVEKDKYILKSLNAHDESTNMEFKRLDDIDIIGTCIGVIME